MTQQPGLALPTVVGPSQGEEQAIEARWDTYKRAEAELAQEGVFPEQQPNFVFPDLTRELLTSHDNSGYADACRCANAWLDYVADRIADTENRLAQLMGQHIDVQEVIREKILQAVPIGKKLPTKAEQENIIKSSPRYRELATEMQLLQQKNRKYKVKADKYDRAIKLLSRNVEIRRQSWEGGRSQAGGRPGTVPGRMT